MSLVFVDADGMWSTRGLPAWIKVCCLSFRTSELSESTFAVRVKFDYLYQTSAHVFGQIFARNWFRKLG